MLTVQACQQHRLAAMNPNEAKSFPAAIVSAVAKLENRRRGKRGTRSEERRNARRAQASKRQCRRWRSRGVVGWPYPARRKEEGANLGSKHLEELSERRRAFAQKSDGGSGRRGSPSARNTRPPGRGLGWKSSRSVLLAFVEAAALRSIVLRYAGAPIATRFIFLFLEMSLFPSIFGTISAFSLYGEYAVRSFLPNGVFLPCDHGLDFRHHLM